MSDVEVYGFAVGHIPLFPRLHKGCKEALDIIKEQEGLIGLHEVGRRGNILLFRSKNEAIIARNVMSGRGIACGTDIGKFLVDEKYVKD